MSKENQKPMYPKFDGKAAAIEPKPAIEKEEDTFEIMKTCPVCGYDKARCKRNGNVTECECPYCEAKFTINNLPESEG